MQLVIDTAQTKITVKEKCFYIVSQTAKRQISPKRISSIAITSNTMVSAKAIMLGAENQVPIYYHDRLGDVKAKMWSPYFTNLASLRRKQAIATSTAFSLKFTVQNILLKLDVQEKLINRLAHHHRLENRAEEFIAHLSKSKQAFTELIQPDKTVNDVRSTIMGTEGAISRKYWQTINYFMPERYRFNGRSRRPAKDCLNAAINYGYGMTYAVVEQSVFAAGLDPHIGFLHTENYRKTSLVFDLIEPIRPVVDELIVKLFSDDHLDSKCFSHDNGGYMLNKKGKAVLIPAYNEYLLVRIKFNGQVGKLKDHIFNHCSQLAQQLKSIEL